MRRRGNVTRRRRRCKFAKGSASLFRSRGHPDSNTSCRSPLIEIGQDEDGLDGDVMNSCSKKMSSHVGSTSQRFLEQQSWKM